MEAQARYEEARAQAYEIQAMAEEYNSKFADGPPGADASTLLGKQRFYRQVSELVRQQEHVVNRMKSDLDTALAELSRAQSKVMTIETLLQKRAQAHRKAVERKLERSRIAPRPSRIV